MAAPTLTSAEVERIALLARLALTEEEKTRYAEQLSAVLDYAAALSQVDVEGLPPTASVLDVVNVMRRADEPHPGLTQAEALANAPASDGACFEVQSTFEADFDADA